MRGCTWGEWSESGGMPWGEGCLQHWWDGAQTALKAGQECTALAQRGRITVSQVAQQARGQAGVAAGDRQRRLLRQEQQHRARPQHGGQMAQGSG